MGKRHQASRRRAYGRRQHELRERFERPHLGSDQPIRVEVLDTAAYDDSLDVFPAFDFAIASGLQYALRD